MEASEFVPVLSSRLHPAGRVFVLAGALVPERSSLLRGKTVRPLERLTEALAECGFLIEEAPHYEVTDAEVPDAVVFDGAALLKAATPPHSSGHAEVAPDLNRMRELSANPDFETVKFVALVSERMTTAELLELQDAGASAFLSEEASSLEMVGRLQNAVELRRARAEIAELRAQIARGLRVDDVTGVMTRRFFFQQAHRECARARRYGHPLSCLMVEVDHYRMLCARYTDAAGESVLRSVATLIGQWTRDSDIIARFAESKFIVLLPETDIDGATFAREKLLNALKEQPWPKDSEEIPVSVSVGEAQLERIQLFRPDAEDSSESDDMGETALSTREAMAGLLEDADAALAISRKGARVPGVLVPQMFVETPIS